MTLRRWLRRINPFGPRNTALRKSLLEPIDRPDFHERLRELTEKHNAKPPSITNKEGP